MMGFASLSPTVEQSQPAGKPPARIERKAANVQNSAGRRL